MSLPIALQLYSIKDETEKNFSSALKKVSQIGYSGVEFAGYGGLSSSKLKALLEELGLKVCGSHVSLDELTKNIDKVIEYSLEIGNPYLICPYATYKNREDYEKMAETLNVLSIKCSEKGILLGYHNHGHEFQKFNGEYGLDIIYKETNAKLVKAEIDTYWVKYAGLDPVEYIKKHAGRCDLIHIKDMELIDGEKRSTEVGNGIMDIKSIIMESEKQGAKWLIVEQEFFNKPTLESVEIGFNNLKKLI
ncbi:sugar phosphate isomerase/epimerase [Clostridium estertheticum]|uniref:sugar phosphate isomerase/epimerase family protein n=1 Tax=Clostridium estertheticum TaxID=238834 RepID=UPI001C7DF61A|nr:sugar phosphate isomerase/epimerase [Clostridium estertheticum]MBX4260086.1 sugar phosphate isomerase/epimerase [Clostridium estertheticum]WLC72099.1 sugar phosphate isomerase/epimerase [Clostridium estertheticum]